MSVRLLDGDSQAWGLGFRAEAQLEQGFGAHYTITIVRNPQNSIGNY